MTYTQERYIITDGRLVAIKSSGTVHLSPIDNWCDVCVYKEYNTARRALEKNPTVLGKCEVRKIIISYDTEDIRKGGE